MHPTASIGVGGAMTWDIIYGAAGAILASMTLLDVFETVVVPGGSRASLKVARRLVIILLPIWKAVRGKRHGLSGTFAPMVLVLSFMIWITLLAFGFGLMAYAARYHFQPVLKSIPDAVYMVGSSIVTIGVSDEIALGFGRWLVLSAGFCGLAVMTMAVTYLLEVQGSVSKRDIGIIKLNTAAGQPPSALTLLQRFAAIGNRSELVEILRGARDWCATVRQSHSNHPSLIYFQSVATGTGWPAALGAMLDLALLCEQCIEDETLRGAAVLLREEGGDMARELADVVHLKPEKADGNEPELKQAAEQLRASGYPIREDVNFSAMASHRALYRSCVKALADHLRKPASTLVRQG